MVGIRCRYPNQHCDKSAKIYSANKKYFLKIRARWERVDDTDASTNPEFDLRHQNPQNRRMRDVKLINVDERQKTKFAFAGGFKIHF